MHINERGDKDINRIRDKDISKVRYKSEDEDILDFVYISERGNLCGDSPRGRDSDWTTPAIKAPTIINSPIINIITAYTNSIGSRRYSCVLLLSINNTAL